VRVLGDALGDAEPDLLGHGDAPGEAHAIEYGEIDLLDGQLEPAAVGGPEDLPERSLPDGFVVEGKHVPSARHLLVGTATERGPHQLGVDVNSMHRSNGSADAHLAPCRFHLSLPSRTRAGFSIFVRVADIMIVLLTLSQ
jgi:hypothetical protein